MTAKTIARLDTVANIILLVWVGMVFCVNLFIIPLIFKYISSYELAALMISKIATRLDAAAWVVFGVAFLLVKCARFLTGIVESEVIGYMRIWSAASTLALLICFTSTFIVSPKLCAIRSHVGIAMEVSSVTCNEDTLFHKKVIKISRQLMWLRLALAFGMALGIRTLPRQTHTEAIWQ